MPISRLSITVTGTGESRAAKAADSAVADMAPDRWTDTIDCAPAAASDS